MTLVQISPQKSPVYICYLSLITNSLHFHLNVFWVTLVIIDWTSGPRRQTCVPMISLPANELYTLRHVVSFLLSKKDLIQEF